MPGSTRVECDGEDILINGETTYTDRTDDGNRVEGLLFNSRMIQAVFDDENPETRDRWAYPDTGEWDPERNVTEFCDALPAWRDHGLRGFTINLQCGSPEGYSAEQPWVVSAFESDGSMKPAWQDRVERVLETADRHGMAVILGYFYFGQDDVFPDEDAIRAATRNATGWIDDLPYRNLIVEIANECNAVYDHDIIREDRVPELIRLVRETSDGRFPVGTSFGGGTIPPDPVVEASDVVLLHGDGVDDPDRIGEMVREVRNRPSYEPMPIIFNEDDHFGFDDPPTNASVALEHHASWGYFDPGESNYSDGYQCPPVEWSINTERKRSFFEWVARVTGNTE